VRAYGPGEAAAEAAAAQRVAPPPAALSYRTGTPGRPRQSAHPARGSFVQSQEAQSILERGFVSPSPVLAPRPAPAP